MSSFSALLKRDLRLAMRQGGGAGMAIGFFLIVVSMVPLGVGPDLNLLARVAPGLLWAALLLAALLTLERIFQADYEDGSLDAIVMGSMPLELAAVGKILLAFGSEDVLERVLIGRAGDSSFDPERLRAQGWAGEVSI